MNEPPASPGRAGPCHCPHPLENGEGRCVFCARDLPEPSPLVETVSTKPLLSPAARAEAQRILDGAARRKLAARLDGDSVGPAPRLDDGLGDRGTDERAPLVDGEVVPVSGRDDDGGNGRVDELG